MNFILFHLAIFGLYFFLRDDSYYSKQNASLMISAIWDFLLLMFFTIPHTFLLSAKGRKLTGTFPPKLHMTIYATHASVALLCMYFFWIPFGPKIEFIGMQKMIINIFYIFSWILMAWSIYATGAMRQIGMEQWWKHLKNKPLNYKIPYEGPYHWIRHPIYTSFFGMIWFTPHWSYSHLLLSITWSIYLILGANNKDARLIKNLEYQQYFKRTPASPLQLLAKVFCRGFDAKRR